VGLFVGLERERRGKEAGLRTFGFAGLLGGLGGTLGTPYAILALLLLGVLVIILNVQTLRHDNDTELTTSAALLVVGFTGILCGRGETLIPVSLALVTAGLLAWKERLVGFSIGLTEAEIRAAILLGILAFVVYPALPEGTVDPWGLIAPRVAWIAVILIAAIGFANHVLLKMYGARGVELAGFLGGFINTTVTVTELANRNREMRGRFTAVAYRGVMLTNTAMLLRNAILLALLAPRVLITAALPLGLMMIATVACAFLTAPADTSEEAAAPLGLKSPFVLGAALRFGLAFLALQVGGTLAQRLLGNTGFYLISLVGGLISSVSTVASAATLSRQGTLDPSTAGIGVIIAALASVLINLPLIARLAGDRTLTQRLALSLGAMVGVGIVGTLGAAPLVAFVTARLTP
jgi:uncharacterized membrane protein (DUF4010 family)